MLATLRMFSLLSIEAVPVDIEVDLAPAGLPEHAASTDLSITLGVPAGSG